MFKNNLDNKFGQCCDCPGLLTGKQYFTNFVSSRIHNEELKKNFGATDSNSYRQKLQSNATMYILNENNKYVNDKCKSNNQNKFYIDSTNYNFSTNLVNEYNAPSIPNNYIKKSDKASF